MAQMMIRNLDDAVAARLKRRAADQRTSVEEQARRVLSAETAPDIQSIIARMNAIAARIGPLDGPTIVEDLRADRARDDLP
jgi:antitoxin FitA